MGKLFEEQEDGSLKAIETLAPELMRRMKAYGELKGRGLTLEEIELILSTPNL